MTPKVNSNQIPIQIFTPRSTPPRSTPPSSTSPSSTPPSSTPTLSSTSPQSKPELLSLFNHRLTTICEPRHPDCDCENICHQECVIDCDCECQSHPVEDNSLNLSLVKSWTSGDIISCRPFYNSMAQKLNVKN